MYTEPRTFLLMVHDVAVSQVFGVSSPVFSTIMLIWAEIESVALAVALELCFPAPEDIIEWEGAHAVQPSDWKWMIGPSVDVNCGYSPLPPSIFEPASPSETS